MSRRTARRLCLALLIEALWDGAVVAMDVHIGSTGFVVIALAFVGAASAWMSGFFANAWIEAPPERRIVPLAPVERARQAEYDG